MAQRSEYDFIECYMTRYPASTSYTRGHGVQVRHHTCIHWWEWTVIASSSRQKIRKRENNLEQCCSWPRAETVANIWTASFFRIADIYICNHNNNHKSDCRVCSIVKDTFCVWLTCTLIQIMKTKIYYSTYMSSSKAYHSNSNSLFVLHTAQNLKLPRIFLDQTLDVWDPL